MRLLILILISFALQILSFNSQAKDKQKVVSLKKVVVLGTVPGPDLWKVSKGENVLWILGTLSPLPKKIDWNSKPIEKVIENSQALLLPPAVTAEIGFFKGLSLAKSAIGIKKNPQKQKLKDLMPQGLYSRWLVLKNKYMGRNKKIEKTRPLFASQKLFENAIKKSGLKSDSKVTKKVRKFAKKNKLEFLTPKITIELNEPKAALKKLKKTEINDLECFTKTLERLEVDLENMKSRAIAWSYGDIETIKSLPYPNDNQACTSAFLNSEFAQNVGLKDIRPRLKTVWLDEAKKAISTNKSTFAILPISQLLRSDGFLQDLEAQGYKIEAPNTEEEEDEIPII
jgi:hypothetical protein